MIILETPQTPEDIPRLFAEAWNAKDATALAYLFADDAEFVNVVGLWWHNRDDIESAHDYGLRTFFKASTLSARRVEIKNLGQDVAVVHVRWKLSGQAGKDGGTLEDRFTIMVFVAQQLENGWTVVAAHNTDIIPGKETLAARDGQLDAEDYRE
jgi:uncharacterized protein (TIGR02246 family)